MSKVYAIIPARGGSKGIPKKNLSTLNGRTLVEIGVNVCIGADSISKVFVSTDDVDIKEEALRFGAEVIDRPKDISGDKSTSEEALLHVIDKISEMGHERPDTILFYQITNALTASADIDNAYDHFLKSNADSLFTAAPFIGCLWERKGGNIIPIHHDYTKRLMRQDMPECYSENGAFYLMDTDGFVKNKHRFFGKIEMFEMGPASMHDIDEPLDLKISEFLIKELK